MVYIKAEFILWELKLPAGLFQPPMFITQPALAEVVANLVN
jgi:hypothetical protein